MQEQSKLSVCKRIESSNMDSQQIAIIRSVCKNNQFKVNSRLTVKVISLILISYPLFNEDIIEMIIINKSITILDVLVRGNIIGSF